MVQFTLYAITGEEHHPGKDLIEVMEQAILGGADIVQLRDKHSDKRTLLRKAVELRELTSHYRVPFIVNDHIDVAIAAGADGIHLGQEDLPLAAARRVVGPDMIIGVSTHCIEQARAAEREGADYIGVGPVFATPTKQGKTPVTLDYVRQAAAEMRIPFVAIGGIHLHNVDAVIEAGAVRVAAIREIVGSTDVKAVCRQFAEKLRRAERTGAAKAVDRA